MADPDTFDVEQLNFFRTCCTTYQVIPDGLRKVFKKEWDARYQTSHGEWNDTAKNGADFFSLIPPKEQKLKAKELSIIRNGNRGEWDCTCLFYAILYSDCIGKNGLHSKVKKAVDDLRQYRNKYAHYHQCKVTDADFQTSTQDVINAFDDLKLDTNVVKKLKSQTSFQTDELQKIQEQLDKEKRRNQELQTFCDLPPKPSHEAIPRSSEVDSIIKEMKSLQSLHPNEVTYVYLSGNPGSGKSETARQIGERVFDETASAALPTFVATLNASSVDTLLRSYINFSRLLRIEEDYIQSIICSKALSQPEDKIWNLIGLVNPKLALFSSWLLIVDNVVDLKKSSMFFPTLRQKATGKGQVLVTTQDSHSISPTSPKICHKSLSEGMKPDDAVHALCTISQQYQDEDVVIEIAKALDFQPLALACTAVYMNLVNQYRSTFTWPNCLTKIQEGKREQTEKPYINASGQVYPQSMTTAVKIALSKVIQEDKIMVLAFEYLSVLAQDPIPIKYLVQYVQLFMPDEGEELIEAHIARSSLVFIADDSHDIHVHQIVHSILQETIRPAVQGDFLKLTKVISTFSYLNTSDDEAADYNFVKAARYLAQHFKVLVEIVQSNFSFFRTSNASNKDDRIAVAKCLCRSIGEAFLLNGEFRSSQTCFEMSLALYNDNGCEATDILMVRNKLGEIHYDLGEFPEARVFFEEALTRFQYSLNDNNEQDCSYYLRTITNLAMTTSRLEEFNEAEKYVKDSISLLENCGSSPFLGKILNNLAMASNNLNKHAEAKTFMQKALSVDQKRFGKDHPYLFERYNDLGFVLMKVGKYVDAKEYFELAIRIAESGCNKNSRNLAVALVNLGCLLRDLNQYDDAKKCLEKALEIDEKIYDNNHPALTIDLSHLGSVLQGLRQYEEAMKCMERALAIDERIYDDNHPTLAIHLCNLGSVLQDLGQYEEARKCLERALAINERTYDDNHPTLAKNLNNLGLVLRSLRQYEESKTSIERAVAIDEHIYGDNHPTLAKHLCNLVYVLLDLQHYEEAKKCKERAVAIFVYSYFKEH